MTADDAPTDYYEVLQISVTAEPETVHRVYRLLAQRYHPDNADTGNDAKFRRISEAYRVLSEPAERARYDAIHERQRQERWHFAQLGAATNSDFDAAREMRVMVLEVLYSKRRLEPQEPGMFQIELEKLTGSPREHLDFAVWYLTQKKLVNRTDNSRLAITVDGIDYFEARHQSTPMSRRLAAVNG